jgi:predicted nucleotidyltransferase
VRVGKKRGGDSPRKGLAPYKVMHIMTLAIGDDFRKALAPALRSKQEYAARHGYSYVEGGEEFWDRKRPIPWSKVPFVLSMLERLAEGEYVFLSDADVLITNPALRLEELVIPLLPAGKDLLMTIDACGHINSGNILMRNSPWLRDWWRRVGEQEDLLYHIWWENAAMIRLLETVPADLAKTEITVEHVRFNAYLRGLPGQPLWTPGCFLVHFAGVYNPKEMERLQAEILGGGIPRIAM